MLKNINKKFLTRFFLISIGVVVLLGIFFRFYKITQDQFVYYDEGMWLNANRNFVNLVQSNPPKDLSQLFKILQISARMSLSTAKALWAFISSLRVFFVGADSWYFVRVVSSVFGVFTLIFVYLFAKRFYDSKWVGLLSVAIFSVLPSHVYYSRLGLQEAFSTFCFVLGLYLYIFPKKIGVRTIISAVFFSFVYFSNYRMIIIPFVVLFCDIYLGLVNKTKPNFKKFILNVIIFSALVFGIGSIKVGQYTNWYITSAWMFRQGHIAKGHFDAFNLLSYPYYLFTLESLFFGVLFFANIYFFMKKQYYKAFPFVLVLIFMVPFSFFLEKGVRYLCAVMPFMAISIAALVFYFYEHLNNVRRKSLLVIFVALMFISQIANCIKIVNFTTAYGSSINDIIMRDPYAKIISTQDMVQSLYVKKQDDVVGLKSELYDLVDLYKKGYKYLIVDPQAYVYLEENDKRFEKNLPNFLQYIIKYVPPIRRYDHFSSALLKRFVLEHNENLRNSLAFLNSNNDGELGSLKVYDVSTALSFLKNLSYAK